MPINARELLSSAVFVKLSASQCLVHRSLRFVALVNFFLSSSIYSSEALKAFFGKMGEAAKEVTFSFCYDQSLWQTRALTYTEKAMAISTGVERVARVN